MQEIIEKCESHDSLKIHISGNLESNWTNFQDQFKIVSAAGGLVKNSDGQCLLIYRNGKWDLPKGKLEKNEHIEQCAVREVAEECGIAEPTILHPLTTTYHTYTLNNRRILKPTYWFLMKSEDKSELVPQLEEGITNVVWVSNSEAEKCIADSFSSIQEVWNKAKGDK